MDSTNIEFYTDKIVFLNSEDKPNIDFIPSIMRRRLSNADKYTLSVLNDIYTDDIQNIVYSSKYGEAERLFKMIEQYKSDGKTSPNIFSSSVHNFPVGFFLFNNKKSIPYNAISACENSISAGFLSALCSNYKNIIFCYTDTKNGNTVSFGININKANKIEKSNKYRLYVCNNELTDDNFEKYVLLFTNKVDKIETPLFKLERV